MSQAIDLAVKEQYNLVSFVHGGTNAYYTDWTSDVEFEGNDYVSTPAMNIELPPNDGLFDVSECKIDLPLAPLSTDFTQRISNGEPHAHVTVKVVEVNLSTTPGASRNTNRVFEGEITLARRNFRGHPNLIQIEVQAAKSQMDVSLGIPCTHQCINRLGDDACGISLALGVNSFNLVMSSIDGHEVVMASAPTGKIDRYFQKGYMLFQGLAIDIKDWRNSIISDFTMVRQPPAHWVGQTVQVFAGCNKSVQRCGQWANLSQFNGRGRAMPSYQPNFEEGDSGTGGGKK